MRTPLAGHSKTPSDASLLEGLGDLKPSNPPQPLGTTTAGISNATASARNRPLSVVSDSSLLQVYQASEADSTDKASVFSSERTETVAANKGKAPVATTVVNSEVAVATMGSRSQTPVSQVGTSSSQSAIAALGGNSASMAAVVAAAAMGSQKPPLRGHGHGRRDSNASSVFAIDAVASDIPRASFAAESKANQASLSVQQLASQGCKDSCTSQPIRRMLKACLIVEGRGKHLRQFVESKVFELFPPPLTGEC
jgi:hypothetical protein